MVLIKTSLVLKLANIINNILTSAGYWVGIPCRLGTIAVLFVINCNDDNPKVSLIFLSELLCWYTLADWAMITNMISFTGTVINSKILPPLLWFEGLSLNESHYSCINWRSKIWPSNNVYFGFYRSRGDTEGPLEQCI